VCAVCNVGGALCSSLSKLKSKKTAQANKLTAAWVDSMPITISDDDDDDDNEAVPPDNQPSNDTHPAAEPAQCEADQRPSVGSDAVPQTSDIAKPSDVEMFSVETAPGELHALEHSYAIDDTLSVAKPVNADDGKSSMGMLPYETANGKSPAQAPENTDDLKHVDSLNTVESTDAVMTTSAAELPAAESGDVGMEGHAEGVPVINGGPYTCQSTGTKDDDKTEASAVEGDHVYTGGMFSYCIFIHLF